MNAKPFLLLFLSCFTLSACQTLELAWNDLTNFKDSQPVNNVERREAKIENPCPTVRIIDELSSLSEFKGNSDKESQLISRVNLNQVESSCNFERGHVAVDLKLAFESALGPKAKIKNSDKPFFAYPFFVAVTNDDDEILAKEVFAASIAYKRDEDSHMYYEKLKQLIPISRNSQARNYNILIGFQLTAKQLKFNRENMVMVDDPAGKFDAVQM